MKSSSISRSRLGARPRERSETPRPVAAALMAPARARVPRLLGRALGGASSPKVSSVRRKSGDWLSSTRDRGRSCHDIERSPGPRPVRCPSNGVHDRQKREMGGEGANHDEDEVEGRPRGRVAQGNGEPALARCTRRALRALRKPTCIVHTCPGRGRRAGPRGAAGDGGARRGEGLSAHRDAAPDASACALRRTGARRFTTPPSSRHRPDPFQGAAHNGGARGATHTQRGSAARDR